MNWLKRWMEAAKDQDKFWADWHRRRREKQLAYHLRQRDKHYRLAASASRMVIYYQGLLSE